jgi:hypothetical protein
MLCETHKDTVFNACRRVLALGGIALVATGATRVHLPHQAGAPLPAAAGHHVVGTAVRMPVGAPPAKAEPAVRRLGAAQARATISLYEHSVRQSNLRGQGCEAAKRGVGGVVILDFGQPAYNGHTYGTYLFSGAFAGNKQITRAMLAYAVGYRRCLPKGSRLSISLARGTSNYHPQVPSAYQAGRRWARETRELEALLRARDLDEHVVSAAADDVEPAWDRTFHRTRDFFRGYRDAGTGHVLYNFGSLDGGIGSIWNARQIFFVASGMKYVAAIPEIYNSAMANEWAELAHIAKNRYHRPMKFAGVMTTRTSGNHAMKPRDAHKVLVRALANAGATATAVPATLTNIRFADS